MSKIFLPLPQFQKHKFKKEDMSRKAPLKIFSCTKSVDLTKRICDSLGVEMGKNIVSDFFGW